jgi:prepilin-type N-terminal cleavage/methylation domain-containing protein
MQRRIKKADGFTLIEMMVAVSIFVIVALIASGALMTAQRISQKARAVKLVMDNLNFALDSMALKMRQGRVYSCVADWTDPQSYTPPDTPVQCSGGGNGVYFELTDGSKAFLFQKKETLEGGGMIEYAETTDKNTDGEFDFGGAGTIIASITRSDLDIETMRFYVFNPNSLPQSWSRVWVTLYGQTRVGGGETTKFGLQMTLSQRL